MHGHPAGSKGLSVSVMSCAPMHSVDGTIERSRRSQLVYIGYYRFFIRNGTVKPIECIKKLR
jgi:hypothetical protein